MDPGFLVIDDRLMARCGLSLDRVDVDELFRQTWMPVGNRMLRPLMISDRLGTTNMIRFPGALLRRTGVSISAQSDCREGSAYTVAVPELQGSTARWLPVVEEAPAPGAGPGAESYSLAGGGWAGVRINYPFQSAAFLNWQETGTVNPRTGKPFMEIEGYVPDEQISDVDLDRVDGARISKSTTQGALDPYSGALGLGTVYSIPGVDGQPRPVRPYRRILSATAGFRREIYLPGLP